LAATLEAVTIRNMEKASPERRVRRSMNCAEALSLLLEATRERARLQSLALSDKTGILVAGAGPARECDEIAAWAPIVLGTAESEAGSAGLFGVKVRGLEAYLCTKTGGKRSLKALSEAAEGCARILGVRRLEPRA
jgi:hypothetical protein